MEIRTLRYVVAIADCKNLTKAAEALYVGQPTLSKSLAAAEEKLGLKLFRKVGHTYMPTPAGQRFVEKAREILRLNEDLDTEMSDILKRNEGELNISFANMRGSYMLPVVLPAFHRRFPNVRVNVFEGSSDENDRRLLEGRIDIAFYTEPHEPDSRIEYTPLTREELLVCASAGSPLTRLVKSDPGSRYPGLDLTLIRDELVIMMRPEQRTRQIVDSILREKRLRFEKVLYSSNIYTILGLIAAGYGISFVFDSHLRHRNDTAPIECFRIEDARTEYDFVAATRRGAYLSPYGMDFIETVRSAI